MAEGEEEEEEKEDEEDGALLRNRIFQRSFLSGMRMAATRPKKVKSK